MINNETLNTLATKLDSLELSDDEAQALDLVLTRAASKENEVQGFSFNVKSAGLSRTGLRLGAAIGSLGLSAPELRSELTEFKARPELR